MMIHAVAMAVCVFVAFAVAFVEDVMRRKSCRMSQT